MTGPQVGALRRLRQQSARRLDPWRDRLRLRGQRRQWGLLIGEASHFAPDQLAIDRLRPLLPPPDRFWADPFLCLHQGQRQLFFEEFLEDRGRGRISTLALDSQGRPLTPEPTTALSLPEHLSYPFLFADQGELFMLPEAGARGRLELYGCVRFPDRWERVQSLMVDVRVKDCTLLRHRGYWWLFCAQGRGRQRLNETLVVFYADRLLTDQWREHAQNPLRRDFTSARPAGRIQQDQHGRLLRPVQNAVPRYGYGLGIQEIVELTPERYRERSVWRTTGPAHGWQGLHHIDWCAGLLALDVQRLI